MDFSDVIGQEETKQRLIQLVEEERVPHAILLCGPQGSGKMALALAFASYLLDNSPLLRQWNHPDLHFIYPTIKLPSMGCEHQPVSDDFAKEWKTMLSRGPYFTLEQWMAAIGAANQQAIITAAESDDLSRKLSLKSSQGGRKVCIVWLPERMNVTCANKLLKLLEEPPEHTVFLMVSENPEQLLETVRSRMQRIDVKRIDDRCLEKALEDKRGLEHEVAHRIARVADGSWTAALEALDSGSENSMFFKLFTMLMRYAYLRDVKGLKQWSESVAALGREKQKRLLAYFSRMVRENFMFNFRNSSLVYMTKEEEQFAGKFSPFVNEANVIDMYDMLEKLRRDIAQNANAKMAFFESALQMIILLRKKP